MRTYTVIAAVVAMVLAAGTGTAAAANRGFVPSSSVEGAWGESASGGAQLAVDESGLTVRCALPPKITKLGRSRIVLAPKRIVDVSRQVCSDRGGDEIAPAS